jgi:hypothetical protein
VVFLLRVRYFFCWLRNCCRLRLFMLVFNCILGCDFCIRNGLMHYHFNKVGSDMADLPVDGRAIFQGEFCIAADQLPEPEIQPILQAAQTEPEVIVTDEPSAGSVMAGVAFAVPSVMVIIKVALAAAMAPVVMVSVMAAAMASSIMPLAFASVMSVFMALTAVVALALASFMLVAIAIAVFLEAATMMGFFRPV